MQDLKKSNQEHDYTEVYGKDFTDKIAHLKEIITEGSTGTEAFNVFAIESGLGKSKYTDQIIDESLNDWENIKTYLVVKRFKEDVEEMSRVLSHHNPPIGFSPTVLGITSDNWGEWKEQTEILKQVRVIIITHARYINICLDDELRQVFTDSREVLIIDEKVNFPIYSFSEIYYENIRKMLPSVAFKEEFDKVCKKLRKILEQHQTAGDQNKVIRIEPKISTNTIKDFLKLVDLNIKDIKDLSNRNAIQNCANGLEQWYSTMCIYNGGNIITFNRKHMLWGLKNNVILDASSSIDAVYQISHDYTVIDKGRIVDHENSTFYNIPFNTSKKNLQQNQNEYYKEIALKIKDYHTENDQTLIVSSKDGYKKVKDELLELGITEIHIPKQPQRENNEESREGKVTQPFAINWFGNIIGKNSYADFTQCWIISTPNIPLGHHLMHYMMYAKRKNLGKNSLELDRGKFKNAEFNKVQAGFVASEIYQSIKRIQRNTKPKGEFFIVNSNDVLIDQVLGQIEGSINRKTFDLEFVQKQKQGRESNHIDAFIDYMKLKPVGEYSKKQISEDLGIKHLYRVLKSDRVQLLEEYNHIKVKSRSIEKVM